MHAATILLADDDDAICTVLKTAMAKRGYRVRVTDDTGTLLRWVQAGEGDVVITDVLMPKGNGLELLPEIKRARPLLPVIVISAQSTLMTAVKATERGAYDYLPKPFDLNALLRCVENSLEAHRRQEPAPASLPADGPLIGTSSAMQEVYRTLARLVPLDLTVLITGESGTGKELVARALHELGNRRHKPFVAINMAAIPRELVESELFGHEKGAFTGANARKAGLFQQAEGGTLFLDEIGDMPLDAQTRLLRVLQQGEYSMVGGAKTHKADVRIIGATHRDLEQLVAQGSFREDLYYRLNVVPIRLPSLRKRAEDIPALCQYFLRKAQEKGLPFKELDDSALRVLQAYSWPGNVRELENMMYRLSALNADVRIHGAAVTALLTQQNASPTAAEAGSLSESARMHLKSHFAQHAPHLPAPGLYDRVMMLVEKPLIELTLKATRYNQLKASQILGINRNTLRKKMDLLGIAKLRGDEEDTA